MSKSAATFVLKVMMVWLLVMYSLALFRNTLFKPVTDALGMDYPFFVGALLAGAVFGVIACTGIALQKKNPLERTTARKNYSAAGIMLSVFGMLMISLGACYDSVLVLFLGESVRMKDWYSWVGTIAITDVICLVSAILLASKIEKTPIEKHKMSFGQFITAIFMNAGVIGAGIIIGLITDKLMVNAVGTSGGQVISDMMMDSNDFWRILTVGIGAPIVEELVFRKLLIDRIHKYGEGIAIFISGIFFGLFHGNFTQFFFATGVGMFMAFIYVRTGKIWYTILLHMVVNMATSVISMKLVSKLDLTKMYTFLELEDMTTPEAEALMMEIMPGLVPFMAWFFFLVASVIVGWVLWIRNRKELFLKKAPEQVEKRKLGTAFLNFGMLYFVIMAVVRFSSFYK